MDEKLKEEIKQVNNMLKELFDEAWKCNNNNEQRTDFTKKCTTYIPRIQQTFGYLADKNEDLDEELMKLKSIFVSFGAIAESGEMWIDNLVEHGKILPNNKD